MDLDVLNRPGEAAGLVPLSDRQRYLTIYRLGLVAVLSGFFAALPQQLGLPWTSYAEACAVYLVACLVTVRAWQARRAVALAVFAFGLLIDGVFLALVTYGASGAGSPLRDLIVVEVVTVTLLASFRTGLKVAIWNILLVTSVFDMQRAGLLHPRVAPTARTSWVSVGTSLGVIMAVTLTTAAFAAVNERELRRRNYDLDVLSRLAWKMEAATVGTDVAAELVSALHDDLGIGRVVLLTAGDSGLEAAAASGLADPLPSAATSAAPSGDDMLQRVVAGQQTVLAGRLEPDVDPWLNSVLPEARNLMACPLQCNGQVIGVLVAEYVARRGSRVERRVLTVVERCVSYGALALASAWLLAASVASSVTDPLTGLPNRRKLDLELADRLTWAEATGFPVGCLMIDVDHFKQINDRYGHPVGDEVLRAVADAMSAQCEPPGLLARQGGEEFVVVLPGADLQAAALFAERLRAVLASTDTPVPVTVSIGVAAYPDSASEASMLIRVADMAVYEAKRAGRNRVSVAPTLSSSPA